jgi:maltose O-acetyltransferase
VVADWIWNLVSRAKARIEKAKLQRRWAHLRHLGMHIGEGVLLPSSTWIDTSHCFLISIGDWCGFGEECLILAHDAQMDEFLDAARIGRVVLHESCHIGARSVILPGVEIGPRTIVGANSVVSKSLPPDSVCSGSPAKVICSLEEYLSRHRERLAVGPRFEYTQYDMTVLTPERRAILVAALQNDDGYMTGGHSEELLGRGGSLRTGFHPLPGSRK